ncbi:MAG: hypothetical protein ACRCWB_01435 [Enterovibrio sp.]
MPLDVSAVVAPLPFGLLESVEGQELAGQGEGLPLLLPWLGVV